MLSQHDQNDQSSLISAEDEELVDEYHAQLLWLYSEYGTGWVVPKAERERLTKKHGLVWCVCFSEYGVTTLWESRATTHGDGNCCCWCEACEDYRHWYWAVGPGPKRKAAEARQLADANPVVEPEACECLADDLEYLAGTASHPRYPVQHACGSCLCRCMPCRARRGYEAHLTSERFRQVADEIRLKAIEEREALAERSRKERERATWEASDEGKAEIARKKAEADAAYAKRLAETRALRARMMKTGPSDGPWVSPGSDPVAAFRKLVVWASSNKIWDPACYGRLFVTRRGHKDVLVELRSNEDCTDKYHVQWRAEEPDGEFCDADCGGTFTVTEIKSLAMLESYIVRKKLHVFYLPPDEEWARWFWFDYDIEQEHKQQVWTDQLWRGCWRLRGTHQLPFRRPDGSEVEWPGYDEQTQFWAEREPEELLAIEAAPAHPATLAGQLAEISMARDFIGSMTDIAAELFRCFGVELSAKRLSNAIKRDAAERELLGVTVEPNGGATGPTGRAEFVVKNHGQYGKYGKNNALTS